MATLGDLTNNLITQGLPISGLDEDGTPHVIEGQSLTQQQNDILTAEFTIWDAQTDAQKLQSTQFQEAKAFAIAIRDALNDITLPSAIDVSTNPHTVFDFNGTTPLGTLPNDADWTAFTNAQVKTFVRQLSLVVARQQQVWVLLYPFIVAHKEGWFEIMKYIKAELDNGN